MDKKNSWKKNKKSFTRSEWLFLSSPFRRQCSLAGVTHGGMSDAIELQATSEFLGVSGRTARRWLFEGGAAHPCAVALLFNLFMGFPQQGKWQGWQLTKDYLISPSSETINPDMIGKLWLWRNERATLQQRINALHFENERLKRMGSPDTQRIIQTAVQSLNSVLNPHEQRRA